MDVKFWKTLGYYIFHAILPVTIFNTVVNVPVNWDRYISLKCDVNFVSVLCTWITYHPYSDFLRAGGLGIEARRRRDFPHPTIPALGPTHSPTMSTGFFPGVRQLVILFFFLFCMFHYYGVILHALVVSYIITQF